MLVDIQTQNYELTDAISAHIDQRIEHTLHHFNEYIQKIHVHLSDVNGSKGGKDKHCLVKVELLKLPSVVVEDTEDDLYLALNQSFSRAGRSVRKAIEKKQTLSRSVDKGSLHEPASEIPAED